MTLYDDAGGRDRLRAMALAFTASARTDALLALLFEEPLASQTACMTDWLASVLGEPRDDAAGRTGASKTLDRSAIPRLVEAQRRRWVQLMMEAATKVRMPSAVLRSLSGLFDALSRTMLYDTERDQ